ncbi:MAG: two-component system sensor histidine kinase NtrB [Hyphomicrobiales bacterium]
MRSRPLTADHSDGTERTGLTLDAARSVHRHAPFGVLGVDRHGRVVSANETAVRLLGFPAPDLLGEDAARVFRAPRGEGHVPPGACAKPEEAREVELVTRSGDILPIALRLLPLEGEDGRLEGTVAVFHDLRETKSREEQWRRRDRLASIGALAAGVAHEIRNPLAGIGTSAQILKRRLPPDDPRGPFADLILEEVARLDRIVSSLLQFARPAKPMLARQAILPALDKALTLVHELAVRQDVLLTVNRADSIPEIYLDLDQILQVFLNVLMNALQALERGGAITVSVRVTRKRAVERSALGRRATDRIRDRLDAPPRDVVEIRIEDNGPGIPAATLARVFDPFFTTRSQGSGLGLSICQSIVREHGGVISIESVVGQGTAVIIDLPVEKRHGDRRRDPR